MQLYDIANPTTSRRIIYDGIISSELLAHKEMVFDDRLGRSVERKYEPHAKDMKCIAIEPGEIVKGVALADAIVERMLANMKKNPVREELQIREHIEEKAAELGDPAPATRPFVWPDQ